MIIRFLRGWWPEKPAPNAKSLRLYRGVPLAATISTIILLTAIQVSFLPRAAPPPPTIQGQVSQSVLLFQKTWGGSSYDVANGVAVDSSGNVYTTGYTLSFGPGRPSRYGLTLLKYNQDGDLVWQRVWSGSGNGSDIGYGVAVDASGGIYVAGYTESYGAGVSDALLLKFDSQGNLLWQRTWGGASSDSANSVAVDLSGNVYVSGYATGLGPYTETAVLLKFNSTGSLLWQRIWSGPGGDYGAGVSVDSSGNIYQTGYTNGTNNMGYDVFLLKYNSMSSLVWQRTWSGFGSNVGLAVAVDVSASIYVTGYTGSFGAGGSDIFLLKFGPTGNLVWQRTWGGTGFDAGNGVAADSSGTVYVMGQTYSFGTGHGDVVLLKFNSTGSLFEQETWGPAIVNGDVGNGIALDSSGNAYETGGVSQPPPYSLGSTGNSTLGKPTFPLGSPAFNANALNVAARLPTGTVQTPTGSQVYAGGSDEFLLKFGSIPTVSFYANPQVGSSITFNGAIYSNGQSENNSYGTVSISANPPADYSFSSWSRTGGIAVASPTTKATTATITGPGTLMANFTPSASLYPSGVLLAATITTVTIALITSRRKPT